MRRRVHVLVALAFLGEKPAGLQVNHIDADKTNNRAANLEYVSPLRNMLHARALWNMGALPRFGMSKLTLAEADRVRAEHASGSTQVAIAAAHGVSQATVSDVVRRKSWTH